MGENSKIAWTTHTFNPWIGCEKISPACDHCYAESYAKRTGQPEMWQGQRRRTRPANWAKPTRWEVDARLAGIRPRVFCASLADVFDNAVPVSWRRDLFMLICETPHLDWLLLTKRIGNAHKMIDEATREWPGYWRDRPWSNVWIGATVANQAEADRDIPKLLEVPAAVRFLSIEPMLEMIDLTPHLWGPLKPCENCTKDIDCECYCYARIEERPAQALHWVICGGESGHHARPLSEIWATDLRGQCGDAKVPFFFKQGSEANWPSFGDFETFPKELQVREFPR